MKLSGRAEGLRFVHKSMMQYILLIGLLFPACIFAVEEITGIILPRDNEGMYVYNDAGQHEINWTSETKVVLLCNTRLFTGLKGRRLNYKIHSSKEVVRYDLPPGPITGIKSVKKGVHLEVALQAAREERWVAEHDLELYFNQMPKHEQLPSVEDLRFIGVWDPAGKPRTLTIQGVPYEISLKKGGQTTAKLYNVLTVKDCRPFVYRATVLGTRQNDVWMADEIHLLPLGDQTSRDNPALPRYLFIGDSISGNYDRGLRDALKGQFNLHHPPTNCGPSGKGAANVTNWLGAYREEGRQWDVISFNHGHWDSGNDKASYQANLEKIIFELKKTGAKLIWVTTCPVPNGYEAAESLNADGRAPGRLAGVMQKYLNPWAAEVMARHPEIHVCDQWGFVKDNEGGTYTEWWKGRDVHFGGPRADALGAFLAEHVRAVTAKK